MTVTIPAPLRTDVPELSQHEVRDPVIHAPETTASEPAPSGSPDAAPSAGDADARARLRADIALAARVLAPSWPLSTFIAVNPLGGMEDQPFEVAVGRATEVFGARGHLPETELRAAYAAGRIGDTHLGAALRRRLGAQLDAPPLRLGGTDIDVAAVLTVDLHHGEAAPPPAKRLRTLAGWCDELHGTAVAAAVDEATIRWVSAWTDEGQAGWGLPARDRGLYAAWQQLAVHDRALPAAARRRLAALPPAPDQALLQLLAEAGVGPALRRELLQAHLAALPGWGSHLRWRADRRGDVQLVELLAIRLFHEVALVSEVRDIERLRDDIARAELAAVRGPGPSTADRAAALLAPLGIEPALVTREELAALERTLEHLPATDRPFVWLDAYEAAYRDPLLARVGAAAPRRAEPAARVRPSAQVVCCIDVRSEGLRRHLEATGPYETLGFAGFFAVAIRFRSVTGGDAVDSCPVLVSPRHEVVELPAPGAGALVDRYLDGQRALDGVDGSLHDAKEEPAAPFVLAEATGWVTGPLAAARTLAPGRLGDLRRRLGLRLAPEPVTRPDVLAAIGPEERALIAEASLTMMGLVEGFGRLVVLCGHDSETEANPYEAALRCGACGGQGGGPNARVAAAILNDPGVRRELMARDITVPEDTWFLAAEHDTTADTVTILDGHLVPETHRSDVVQLERDLAIAGAALSAERCAGLPGAPVDATPSTARRHTADRGRDWAEVFPEWGLAGNAAFVVGPRDLTVGLDLGRRVFLHSYEAAVDRAGTALETILTAPLVVAQWINCQYYFSTVDPEVFGSGTKTIHNVVGRVGVQAGHGGDLRVGLPAQSVRVGGELVHEPMRLLAIVEAPLERISAIIDRNPVLVDLLGNGWIAMAARDEPGRRWMRWTRTGWEPWASEAIDLEVLR